ncbi:MAG TPA: ABC transporter ATP-binding protein [Blastocatellia bacterium]|nr:ABC transporter ATP-binding protein [Blastocatellia bacterium]
MKQGSALWKALSAIRRSAAACRRQVRRLQPLGGRPAFWWGRMRDGNPLLYLFARNWHYSAGNRAKIVIFWSMFIMAEMIDLIFPPLILATIMNVVQREGITAASIRKLGLLLLCSAACTVVFWSLHGPARVLECTNAFKGRANYRSFLLKGVMTLPMEWHAEHHSGNTIDKIEKGTNALFTFSEDSFEVIYSLVRLVGSYSALVYFSRPAAYIVLGMMAITVWITIRFDQLLIRQYKELNRSENIIQESVFDSISNIATVIILRVERLVFSAIMHKVRTPYELYRDNCRLNEWKWFLTSLCCKLTIVIVLGVYFHQHLGTEQGVLIGSLYLLIRYLERLGDLFFRFTGLYGRIVQERAKVANAEILSQDFKEVNLANHVLPADWRLLEVQGLSFSYQGAAGRLQLDNVSLNLRRGWRYAVIGESGGGKTTFLNVLRDIYHPRSLTLAVDGRVVPEGFAGISQAIGYAPQNPELFADTIWKNITMGAEYDERLVRKYTDMALFTKVVEELPNKFDSSINEKGVNLSGGQRQRLALARALAACDDEAKAILLFDEPTSSLDTRTELEVCDNIFRGFPGRTMIFSLHRLHLLTRFDWIYLFEDGRIAASGTFDHLLANCDRFSRMWAQYHLQEAQTAD